MVVPDAAVTGSACATGTVRPLTEARLASESMDDHLWTIGALSRRGSCRQVDLAACHSPLAPPRPHFSWNTFDGLLTACTDSMNIAGHGQLSRYSYISLLGASSGIY